MKGRRGLAAALALLLAVQAGGCAGGRTTLNREELADPEPARHYWVTTRDGRVIPFTALHLEGETLVGTARFTSERMVGEGDAARVAVSNRYEELEIPWAEVVSVEAEGLVSQGRGGLVLVAASVLVGAGVFLLLRGSGEERPTNGGGGKTP